MTADSRVRVEDDGPVRVVTIDRPEVRNAVDGPTADALHEAFVDFDGDDRLAVAVLAGSDGTFCAGADLEAVSRGEMPIHEWGLGRGPMGPTRLEMSKPVIAAVEGHAVAGGLELALWCDLRVVDPRAVFGVFCRRWGVPLIDGGSVRLPRLVGQGVALDLVLTGREVVGEEALRLGLATRLSAVGQALPEALALARELAALPQRCLRNDRASVRGALSMPFHLAMEREWELGRDSLIGAQEGAAQFVAGAGRGGRPVEP